MGKLGKLLAVCATLGALAVQPAVAQTPIEARVTVRADEPGARISPYLHGQFAEHLGFGIYGGVWVGPGSRIPNTRGFRNDVLAALRALEPPVVRWPGGCFADGYHWRDGIGPRAQRPVTLNATWGGVEESNQFGTHEFFDFAELIGADAYLSINVGSGTPQEMAEWIEYITSDTNSRFAQLRRRNGRAEPWRLPFVGIGNETWGCGGSMRPEFSADLHRQFASFVRGVAPAPVRVASGAGGDDTHWTEVLMTNLDPRSHMEAISLHYYTLPTGDWSHKGAGVGFTEEEWIGTLAQTLRMEELVTRHGAIMDRRDPERRIGLYVDEWGTWYDPEPGTNPAFLVQPNTMRDAIVAAINLNIFQNHAERVRMANIAQMVNVLQAMIQTDGPRMALTPTYHVFDLYRPFKDATLLPTQVDAPAYAFGGQSVPSIQVSGARNADGRILLALVNLDPHRGADVMVALNGAEARSVSGRILTAPAMDARNTFDSPQTVAPAPFSGARIDSGGLSVALPAKSVVVLEVQ